MATRINYTEGTCFFAPLRKDRFARGIVARLDRKGGIYAYFFAPQLVNTEVAFDEVRARDAVLCGQCSDLGLLKGNWPQAGTLPNWNRNEWPLPALYREDEVARVAWLSYYDDDTLEFVREERVGFREVPYVQHPYDRLMGYGAVEIRLTQILSLNAGEEA